MRELVELVALEMNKVCDLITSEEIARAKAQMRAGIVMSQESPASLCEQMARQTFIFGRPLSIDEVIGQVEAVDEGAVRTVAKRIFQGTPTLVTLGSEETPRVFETFQAQLG